MCTPATGGRWTLAGGHAAEIKDLRIFQGLNLKYVIHGFNHKESKIRTITFSFYCLFVKILGFWHTFIEAWEREIWGDLENFLRSGLPEKSPEKQLILSKHGNGKFGGISKIFCDRGFRRKVLKRN